MEGFVWYRLVQFLGFGAMLFALTKKPSEASVIRADAQVVEDMILTAANQALSQAKEIYNAEMGKITQGFNLPGLM